MKHVSIGSNVISAVFSWRMAIPPAVKQMLLSAFKSYPGNLLWQNKFGCKRVFVLVGTQWRPFSRNNTEMAFTTLTSDS